MLTFDQGKKIASQMFVLGSYEEFDVHTIIEVLQAADDLYANDEESFLEDNQYDALYLYAQRLAPADLYFTGVGSAVRGGKVQLPYIMGSLDQLYLGDYANWVAKYALGKKKLIISNKLDGGSAMLVYGKDGKLQIAYSRGDGERGADITRHVSRIHNVPKHIDTKGKVVTIRAENIMSPANFQKLKTKITRGGGKPYKNPRNMLTGRMNASENLDIFYTHVETIVYEIVGAVEMSKTEQFAQLEQYGFDVAPYFEAVAGELDEAKLTSLLNLERSTYEYEIDGFVIDIDDAKTRANMAKGSGLNPPYAMKFKVADASNQAIATVKGVEWNISKDGYQKPRVQIHPVELMGVTIQNLTGFNAKFIQDNMVGAGAKLRITRSGDVIPFIQGVVEPAEQADMPDGDNVWSETGVDLIVADAKNNTTVKFEQLLDFFSSIDVPHLGEGNLRQMFDMGFDTPESIIACTQEDICNLVGSVSIGKKIFKGMREKFTNIPLYVLMGSHSAFGRGVGVRKMKKLYEAFRGDMSQCESVTAITMVEGFEHKTAAKIQRGYAPFMEFFNAVSKYVTVANYEAPKQGSLTGKTVVFTGFRNKDLEKAVENAGGKMGTTVSKNTSYLVADDPNGTSTKLTKAREDGILPISVDEFKKLL